MSWVDRVFEVFVALLLLGGPVALVYAWCVYATKLKGQRGNWRSVLTLIALALLSLSYVLLLPVAAYIDGHYAEPKRYYVVRECARLMFRIHAILLLLGFFARGRLIALVTWASLAAALWWTMPLIFY